MFRISNKSKEAIGGLFFNLCALTYAGVILDGIFVGSNIGNVIYGCAFALIFSIIGVFFTEQSNNKWR
ncbi:MAG: hypothetical protein FWF51_08920 [Chitinivibrionia bacterium]|jgi:hypothetical protein|nr:hypothetical protein [Chitinivibrionia bacterium]